MNGWWFFLVPLACLWSLPMIGARQAGAPAVFFLAITVFWMLVSAFAPALYQWGTGAARKMGMVRIADWRDRMASRVLPPARVALTIMAAISAAFGIFGFGSR